MLLQRFYFDSKSETKGQTLRTHKGKVRNSKAKPQQKRRNGKGPKGKTTAKEKEKVKNSKAKP